jgi:SAM-dependent methyltransferase/uncharacterized protein YbaR (Trm112 family)
MQSIEYKLTQILACPHCKSSISPRSKEVICDVCGSSYQVVSDVPILIKKDSPVFDWYDPTRATTYTEDTRLRNLFKLFRRALRPSQRVWTRRSQQVITKMLKDKNPDAAESNVVLIGSGLEPVYRRLLQPYKNIICCGLAHRGETDVCCDICDLPLLQNHIDLIFSSSVLEHVYDPERAVAEMFRVLKPGGYVYAEIPFIRAYHMIPVDYQRYTIAGIENLFKRQGFVTLDKGICSGPFTGLALFLTDITKGMLSFNRYIQTAAYLGLSILLHPIKYLDRLVENAKWAEVNACNFYYLGKKG